MKVFMHSREHSKSNVSNSTCVGFNAVATGKNMKDLRPSNGDMNRRATF